MFKGLLHGGVEFNGFFPNLGFGIARVATGLMMAFGHGLGKVPPSDKFIDGVAAMGFPVPVVFAWAAGLTELVGAFALAFGLATRPAAFLLCCTMATAAFIRHGGDPFSDKEPALLYLMLSLIFLAVGAGRYGLDRRLRV